MVARRPKYSKEEFARRGEAIYNEAICAQIGPHDHGKYVAIDIDSSEWEIDADALAACERLIARHPDAQAWLVRVGYPYIHRLGGAKRVADAT